ncbi:MAG TPA: molybdopterin-dependent oxidoreductase [Syntrophomonadaceae bacterium]|nr:molybdopterin-dependent oxidoreductase [Syntrophomonadaceae bacterium]
MSEWKKTSCVLCAQNCGLEMMIEDNRIVKVKGDKDNPRSQGYTCRKGLNIAHYAHNADRLKYPLKKVGDTHVRISWEQAISEITEKLKSIKEEYGGKSFAYMGGGSLGGQMEIGIGLRLLSLLGSRYYYSSLAQEFSNIFWVDGRVAGKQSLVSLPDSDNADTLVAWGWNGWMSHQTPRARNLIREMAKNPDKKLIVIDPRISETAERADIHLAIKPGTDTMLLKAIIKIILDNSWDDKEYLEKHVNGWEEIAYLFDDFAAKEAIETICQLNYEEVIEVARLIALTKSNIHEDLGIYMNRNSTINSYMLHILRAITGRFCVEGGQIFPTSLFPMGSNTDERHPKTWRTVYNNMFPVMGSFPPAIFPEEILNDHPERLRALIVSACNPLRSYPDTLAYEKAFAALDLSVCIEVVYSETARLSDYVLPSLSYMEAYDTTCFSFSYPEFYFQMRPPVLEPISSEAKEGAAIMLEIIKAMGFLPEIPEYLYKAGDNGITSYLGSFNKFLADNPEHARLAPLILAETLGESLGSVNQALIVGLLLNSNQAFKAGAVSLGYPADFNMFEKMFTDILNNPQGLILSKYTEDNFSMLATEDQKISLYIEELIEPLKAATIEQERISLKLPQDYPLILHSGLHDDNVANTLIRNPEWNKKRRFKTMLMHEDDANELGLNDGDIARITTKASAAEIEVEISKYAAKGCVYIRHGGGLIYDGEKIGVNVNELVLATDRDEMGTPMHRRIPCRVEVAF